MLPEIKYPTDSEFLANLVLQRTGAFINNGGAIALNNWFTKGDKEGIVKHLTSNNLVEKYLSEVTSEVYYEAKELLNSLSKDSLNRIVSVGPGNGLIELLLLKEGYTLEILLIDVEDTDNHHHGFANVGSGYANLKATKEFLLNNVDAKIEICNPKKEPLPSFEFTLFISLLSMGFHYPCDEYVSFIKKNAAQNAFMVFDMRKGIIDYGGTELLEKFPVHNVIQDRKSDRVFLKRA